MILYSWCSKFCSEITMDKWLCLNPPVRIWSPVTFFSSGQKWLYVQRSNVKPCDHVHRRAYTSGVASEWIYVHETDIRVTFVREAIVVAFVAIPVPIKRWRVVYHPLYVCFCAVLCSQRRSKPFDSLASLNRTWSPFSLSRPSCFCVLVANRPLLLLPSHFYPRVAALSHSVYPCTLTTRTLHHLLAAFTSMLWVQFVNGRPTTTRTFVLLPCRYYAAHGPLVVCTNVHTRLAYWSAVRQPRYCARPWSITNRDTAIWIAEPVRTQSCAHTGKYNREQSRQNYLAHRFVSVRACVRSYATTL